MTHRACKVYLKRPRARDSGVTLLEIMIVLAIMSLVTGLAAPRFLDSFGRAKSQAAKVQLANLNGALQLFYIDNGRHPTEAEGLTALIQKPAALGGWRGPYIDDEEGLLDPWGRRYLYGYPTDDGGFEILTYGRDGRAGGSKEDLDLKL